VLTTLIFRSTYYSDFVRRIRDQAFGVYELPTSRAIVQLTLRNLGLEALLAFCLLRLKIGGLVSCTRAWQSLRDCLETCTQSNKILLRFLTIGCFLSVIAFVAHSKLPRMSYTEGQRLLTAWTLVHQGTFKLDQAPFVTSVTPTTASQGDRLIQQEPVFFATLT